MDKKQHYVPKIGQFTKLPHTVQFDATKVDGLSFCTTPIEVIGENCTESATRATGFFWWRQKKSYLITNWHVITGRNAFTKQLNPEGLIPRRLKYFPASQATTSDKNVHITRKPDGEELDLKNTRWFQHAQFDMESIDVVAIELNVNIDEKCHVNLYGHQNLFSYVGSDVFVVGYPLSSYTGFMLPIWKRGSLASEPLFPVDDRPMFLVDAATTEGMSGSPVFRRTFGPAVLANMEIKKKAVVTTEFVGVYAGHLSTPALSKISIGYAWYGKLIDQIIDQQVPGTV